MNTKTSEIIIHLLYRPYVQMEDTTRTNICRTISSFIINNLFSYMKREGLTISEVIELHSNMQNAIAELAYLLEIGDISGSKAKEIFDLCWNNSHSEVMDVILHYNVFDTIDSNELDTIISRVIEDNRKIVEQIMNGKTNAINGLVGKVMKATSGKADPQTVKELLSKTIEQK